MLAETGIQNKVHSIEPSVAAKNLVTAFRPGETKIASLWAKSVSPKRRCTTRIAFRQNSNHNVTDRLRHSTCSANQLHLSEFIQFATKMRSADNCLCIVLALLVASTCCEFTSPGRVQDISNNVATELQPVQETHVQEQARNIANRVRTELFNQTRNNVPAGLTRQDIQVIVNNENVKADMRRAAELLLVQLGTVNIAHSPAERMRLAEYSARGVLEAAIAGAILAKEDNHDMITMVEMRSRYQANANDPLQAEEDARNRWFEIRGSRLQLD